MSKPDTVCREHYPRRVVLVANLNTLALYAAGAFILYRLHYTVLIVFLVYLVWLEVRLLRHSCVDCYYYGKVCAFGKGKLAALVFKPGDPQRFLQRQISWRNLIPEMLVSLVPLMAGIYLLIVGFYWPVLLALLLILFTTTIGNGYVRGSLACKSCRQREIGCPADQLFKQPRA